MNPEQTCIVPISGLLEKPCKGQWLEPIYARRVQEPFWRKSLICRGARKTRCGRQQRETFLAVYNKAIGISRGGRSTKIHALVDGKGRPLHSGITRSEGGSKVEQQQIDAGQMLAELRY